MRTAGKKNCTGRGQLGKADENGGIQMREPLITGFWANGEKYERAQDIFNKTLKE
jgi:hypothetical protein